MHERIPARPRRLRPQPARCATGRAGPGSRCSSSSTTRKAARTASCTATPPPRRSCPRSSAPSRSTGVRHMNMESIYEYGSRAGFWRLLRHVRPNAACRSPSTPSRWRSSATREASAAMNEAGWEIASHGLKWIDYQYMRRGRRTRSTSRRRSASTPRSTGERPLGWYTGPTQPQHPVAWSPRTAASSTTPTPTTTICPTGRGSAGKPQLDRALHARRQRHALRHAAGLQLGRPVLRLSEGQLRRALRRGRARRPKMLSVGLHCRLVGRPGRAAALAASSTTSQGHERVWVCRRIDIARHWHETPPGTGRPGRDLPRAFCPGSVQRHGPARRTRPLHRRAGSAHPALPFPAHKAAPAPGRGLDGGGRDGSASGRRRQRRRPLRGNERRAGRRCCSARTSTRSAMPAATTAISASSPRSQAVADAARAGRAPALRDRGAGLRRRGGRALPGDADRLPRGRRHARSGGARRPRRGRASACARRCSSSAATPPTHRRHRPPQRACRWPMSSCTSSRARCSRPRTCRSASSPRSTAPPASRSR